jgi:hypothetical protein
MIAAPAAYAKTMKFQAKLDASQETPPNDSKATGTADVTYNTTTQRLRWTVNYSGLTGPATGAHFHGPADPGQSADVAVPLQGKLASPIKGSVKLTKAQAKDLEAGKYYLNIHTDAHADGEIRGQVQEQKAGGSM